MTDEIAAIPGDATALIVDDEPDMCWALAHILKGSNIASAAATSGAEALRMTALQRFRLAFVDAKLPDAEGLQLARRIRSDDRQIIIVLVSGYFYGDDPEVLEATAAGTINAFVSKPFLHEEVRRVALAALAL